MNSTGPAPETMDEKQSWFETQVQVVVRALLAVVLVVAYIAFLAFGVDVPEFFTGLVGLAAGFFVGGAVQKR